MSDAERREFFLPALQGGFDWISRRNDEEYFELLEGRNKNKNSRSAAALGRPSGGGRKRGRKGRRWLA